MAAVAGVRHSEFLGELGIGNSETVVMARIALHVNGDGHVTRDALIASAVCAVVAVSGGIDDGGGGEIRTGRGMAIHAKLIAGDDVLVGVWIVAIHAADASVLHAAGHECGELVVLIPDLTVWIEGVGPIS